jgi:hypothetical protein
MEVAVDRSREYGVTFNLTLLHAALLVSGFLILADQFAFPEILRASSQERLGLFHQNQTIITGAYYLMALTGLTQVVLAVMFHQSFARPGSTVLQLALVSGILAGVFQVLGFIRWPIAVPYLADQMAQASTDEMRAIIGLLEGLLNRYAGMAIGEHLGFVGQGFWTIFISIAMFQGRLFSSLYGLVGVFLGALLVVSALEQLGGPFETLGFLSAPVSAAWLGWLVSCGVSLLRTHADGVGPAFGIFSALTMVVLMGALIFPTLS